MISRTPGKVSLLALRSKAMPKIKLPITIVGTAANTTSDVWFTGTNGVLTEMYYPTDDYANSTLMEFLVGDSGHTWVDQEQTGTNSTTTTYDPHSLAWSVGRWPQVRRA